MDQAAQRLLTDYLLPTVLAAGALEMSLFAPGGPTATPVIMKADNSPVTLADQQAEALLMDALHTFDPSISIVGEEAHAAGARPKLSDAIFLVDALDGTKNYVAGLAQFTINIGLVANGVPIYGLIYAPALAEFYVTDGPGRALMADITCNARPMNLEACSPRSIHVRPPPAVGLRALHSRSRTIDLAAPELVGIPIVERQYLGSSYKFCIVARGDGDLYVQQGTTCGWDTAAGEAIVRAAGGVVADCDGGSLKYPRRIDDWLNPPFVASNLPLAQLRQLNGGGR
jgi:3'(2'), 5'-bisphosphate nucleotidase